MAFGAAIQAIGRAADFDNGCVNRVIHIHPLAPAKPASGEACNGCGVCCAAEPCPVGMMISRKTKGACVMLKWSDDDGRYSCGLMLPTFTGRMPRMLAAAVSRIATRLIAAGKGCDCSLEIEAAPERRA